MSVLWDGMTQRKTINESSLQSRIELADAAKAGNWSKVLTVLESDSGNEPIESTAPASIQPPMQKLGPQDFRRGDKVSFTDKYLQPQIGTITRINQRTASVECEDGPGWRVPYGMLSHVMVI